MNVLHPECKMQRGIVEVLNFGNSEHSLELSVLTHHHYYYYSLRKKKKKKKERELSCTLFLYLERCVVRLYIVFFLGTAIYMP